MNTTFCGATNCVYNSSSEIGGVGECQRAILLKVSEDNRIECACYKAREEKHSCGGDCKCQK